MCNRRVVKDTYHVCVECPLFDVMRARMYTALRSHGFYSSSVTNLNSMCTSMLSVGTPPLVRIVGQFLADCLAAREVYTNQPSNGCGYACCVLCTLMPRHV